MEWHQSSCQSACIFVRISSMMNDNDKPEVVLKIAEDRSEAFVVVRFPWLDQAMAFEKVVRSMLDGMQKITSVPKL